MRPSTVTPGDAARPAAHSIAVAICLLLVLLQLPLACARVEEPTSPSGGAKFAAPSIPDDPPPESPPHELVAAESVDVVQPEDPPRQAFEVELDEEPAVEPAPPGPVAGAQPEEAIAAPAEERPDGAPDEGPTNGEVAPDVRRARRLVAIGDVHGDYHTFVRLLRSCGLIDERLAWAAGETVFVQTGDLLDRGDLSRKVLELVMRLEQEAPKAGGKLLFMLGNHEVFNLVGDFRYLTPGELQSYAVDETSEERAKALKSVTDFLRNPSPLLRSTYYARLAETLRRRGVSWHFPPGYVAHRRFFSPEGRYGKWLLAHEAIIKVGRSLFLHAGLGPRFGKTPFRRLRQTFRAELGEYYQLLDDLIQLGVFHPMLGDNDLYFLLDAEQKAGRMDPKVRALADRYSRLRNGAVFAEDGPIWYRGLAQTSERALGGTLDEILELQEVDRIVVGHTRPSDNRIQFRFDERVLLIDTGMNQAYYRGHPEALEILDGKRITVLRLGR